ncbi:MAG: AraC family transcriptional regulator [Clostridia bacterium]|nr:AraC family transcriptional regulator [Clostridia bacterium]
MKTYHSIPKRKKQSILPTVVEKNFPSIPNLSDMTIYESGWENNAPGKSFGPYVRDYYLLHFVLEGKGTYIIDGKELAVKSNQVFLIPPNVTTTYFAHSEDPWKYFWIGFNANQCKDLMESCGFYDGIYILPFTDMPIVKQQIKKLYSIKTDMIAYDYFAHGALYELLGCLLHNSQKDFLPLKNDIYVINAKNYIENHFDEKITITDIARHVGLDRSYFSRFFKLKTKVSPQTYLIDTRLKHALLLISQTNLSFSEISQKCAFNDYSHFYKSFQKKYVRTPKQMRDTMQKNKKSDS